MFVDKTRIYIKSGKGGDGCLSFRREKFIPRGGPDGGNGGRGGDVYIESSPNLNTLLDLIYKPHYKADDGGSGKGKNKHGSDACDLTIKVPCGTVIFSVDADNNRGQVADLKEPFSRVLVARGGRGGRGNLSFKSQYNRAPYLAEKGEPAEEVTAELELKLIADVGIIGCPNAGKSTLLSRITAAKPKIADYPFTTLSPNLGVCTWKGKNFVLADMPGLIEDASCGKGLGGEFLRHVERTKILVHLLDLSGFEGRGPYENFRMINSELEKYSKALMKKPMIIAANKIDITGAGEELKKLRKKFGRKKIYALSAVTGDGARELFDGIISMLEKPAVPEEAAVELEKEYTYKPEFTITREKGGFTVKGRKPENLVAMTNFAQEESVERLQMILKKIGVDRALRRQNVAEGDTVRIGTYEFVYSEPIIK